MGDLSNFAAAFDARCAAAHRAYLETLEQACADALDAAGGDVSRVLREHHPNHDVIKVDDKPFRRVEVVMPGLDEEPVIRIVMTDLTIKETA
jgi:hypothetical protein